MVATRVARVSTALIQSYFRAKLTTPSRGYSAESKKENSPHQPLSTTIAPTQHPDNPAPSIKILVKTSTQKEMPPSATIPFDNKSKLFFSHSTPASLPSTDEDYRQTDISKPDFMFYS